MIILIKFVTCAIVFRRLKFVFIIISVDGGRLYFFCLREIIFQLGEDHMTSCERTHTRAQG